MASKKFIELTSSNRDRNANPNQSSFVALFNQNASAKNTAQTALDPVYESAPEYIFKSNQNNLPVGSNIGGVSSDYASIRLGNWQSNVDDFYNGYHIIISNWAAGSPPTLLRRYDRMITNYVGATQTAYLDHVLPSSATFTSANTTYVLIDTNFNSNIGFDYCANNLQFPVVYQPSGTPNYSQKNNIILDISSLAGSTGVVGYFDNCYFLINDPNYPSYPVKSSDTCSPAFNNVRKIIDCDYDPVNNPESLILYLDTELTFIPPDGATGYITNYDPNLDIYPTVNIQHDDIYGKIDARNGYDNYYNGYYIENVNTSEFREVKNFDDHLNLVQISSPFSQTINTNPKLAGSTGYINYKDMYILRKQKPIDYNYVFPGQFVPSITIPSVGTYSYNTLPSGYYTYPNLNTLNNVGTNKAFIILDNRSNTEEKFYNGLYLRITNIKTNYDIMLKIKEYYPYIITYNSDDKIAVKTPLHLVFVEIPVQYNFTPIYQVVTTPNKYEVLNFSRDNFNPISYSGNLVSQQEPVAHDIELLSLMVPNKPLKNSYSIGAYPYFYVVFETYNSNNKNVIYSNNNKSNKAVFIVKSITEDSNKNYSYLSLPGMTQTVKFKPNENLVFSIYLPNGQPLEFLEEDNFSPYAPKDYLQISGVFAITRC